MVAVILVAGITSEHVAASALHYIAAVRIKFILESAQLKIS